MCRMKEIEIRTDDKSSDVWIRFTSAEIGLLSIWMRTAMKIGRKDLRLSYELICQRVEEARRRRDITKTVMVLILVLWAGMGWAEDQHVTNPYAYSLCSPSAPCGADANGDFRYYQMDTNGYVILSPGQSAPQSLCEHKMQAAMEAMEERVTKKEESEWTIIADGTSTITWNPMQFYDDMPLYPQSEYKPDTRTAEERLEDEFKALEKRKVELAAQRVREAKEQIEREERKAKKDAGE